MKKPDFLHADTDSWKIEIDWHGHGQKRVWPLCSQDSKIGCMSRKNERNKLVFGVLIQIHESKKLL